MEYNFTEKNKLSVKLHVEKYISMLKKQARYYFDIKEFNEIIDFFLEKGKINEAEDAINFGLSLHPYAFELKIKKVHILIDRNEIKIAQKLLYKLKSLQPEEPEIYFLMAYINVINKDIDDAEIFFKKFIKSNIDDSILSSVAFVYEQNGFYNKSLNYLIEAYKINPKNEYVLYDTAYCYEQIGNLKKSAEYYEKYLEEKPFSSNAWYNLGVINNQINRNEKAIEAYDFAIAIKPDFASAYFNKATVLANNKKYKEAIEVHKEFLKIEENNVKSLTYIADCYKNINEFELAFKYYKFALKKDKYYTEALYGISVVCYQNKDYKNGLDYIVKAINTNKNNSEYHYMSGLFYYQLGFYDKSEKNFLISLEIDPFPKKTWLSYSDLFLYKNNKKIIEILNKAEKHIPDNAEINYRLAAHYFLEKKYKNANKHLEKALTIEPDSFQTFLDYCPNALI